jgi:hypothetical protein
MEACSLAKYLNGRKIMSERVFIGKIVASPDVVGSLKRRRTVRQSDRRSHLVPPGGIEVREESRSQPHTLLRTASLNLDPARNKYVESEYVD